MGAYCLSRSARCRRSSNRHLESSAARVYDTGHGAFDFSACAAFRSFVESRYKGAQKRLDSHCRVGYGRRVGLHVGCGSSSAFCRWHGRRASLVVWRHGVGAETVSVVALFRRIGMDQRLTMIMEGESLFNDGTAVVLFQLVLAIVVSGAQWSIHAAIGSFCLIVLGGIVLGSIIGYVASGITSAFDDHLLEITLTMVAAYGGFLIANRIGVSAVITVVVAGIIVGNYGGRTGMSATTRLAVNSFWEYAAFLVNSILFLLIGLQIQVPLLQKYAQLIGYGALAVIVSRLLVVYGICPFVSTERLPIPDKWRHLLFWGGLRGALVMALALSLPLNFPEREAIINMTFGVVLFTLLGARANNRASGAVFRPCSNETI